MVTRPCKCKIAGLKTKVTDRVNRSRMHEIFHHMLTGSELTSEQFPHIYVDPPVGWGSTYCFTAVGVRVLVGVRVGITPITKAPPAQIFFGWHVFCSPGH